MLPLYKQIQHLNNGGLMANKKRTGKRHVATGKPNGRPYKMTTELCMNKASIRTRAWREKQQRAMVEAYEALAKE